jgi:hypothetical protein
VQSESCSQKLQVAVRGLQVQLPLEPHCPVGQAAVSAWQLLIWHTPASNEQSPLRHSESAVQGEQMVGVQLHEPSGAHSPPAARQAPASAEQLVISQVPFPPQIPEAHSALAKHEAHTASGTGQAHVPSVLQLPPTLPQASETCVEELQAVVWQMPVAQLSPDAQSLSVTQVPHSCCTLQSQVLVTVEHRPPACAQSMNCVAEQELTSQTPPASRSQIPLAQSPPHTQPVLQVA